MAEYIYKTQGTCSREIRMTIEDGILKDVTFVGGCPGNLLGIKALTKNQPIDTIIEKLKGIRCGMKSTSCPDQLSKALQEIKQKV